MNGWPLFLAWASAIVAVWVVAWLVFGAWAPVVIGLVMLYVWWDRNLARQR